MTSVTSSGNPAVLVRITILSTTNSPALARIVTRCGPEVLSPALNWQLATGLTTDVRPRRKSFRHPPHGGAVHHPRHFPDPRLWTVASAGDAERLLLARRGKESHSQRARAGAARKNSRPRRPHDRRQLSVVLRAAAARLQPAILPPTPTSSRRDFIWTRTKCVHASGTSRRCRSISRSS